MGLAPINKKPIPTTPDIQKYTGTAYDKVQIVADNIDAIIQLSGAIPTDIGSYYGPLESVPTTRPNGDPSLEGDTYLDMSNGLIKVLNNGSWELLEAVSSIPGIELKVARYIVSDPDNRVITIPDNLTYLVGVNNLQVSVNGLSKDVNYDYSETSPVKITYLSELESGDVVTFRIGKPIQNIPTEVTVDGDIIKYDVATDFHEKHGITALDKVVYLAGYETLSDGRTGFYLYDASGFQGSADGKLIIDPTVSLDLQGTGAGYGVWVKQVFLPEVTPGGSYVGAVAPENVLPGSRWTNTTTMKTYVLWKNSNCTMHWVEDKPTYVTAKGDPGEKGADGADGANGIDGTNGTNGTNGIDGIDGEDGKSAYQVALDNGFEGTEAEWLASLQGADGVDGTNSTDIQVIETPDAAITVPSNANGYFYHSFSPTSAVFTLGSANVGDVVFVKWLSGESVSFAAADGFTLHSAFSNALYGVNSVAAAIYLGSNVWSLVGDLATLDVDVGSSSSTYLPEVAPWDSSTYLNAITHDWPVRLEFTNTGIVYPQYADSIWFVEDIYGNNLTPPTSFRWLTENAPSATDGQYEVRFTFVSSTGGNEANYLKLYEGAEEWRPLVFDSVSTYSNPSFYNGNAVLAYGDIAGYIYSGEEPTITVLMEIREVANPSNIVAGELFTKQGAVPE